MTREGSLHTPPLAHGYPFYVLVETLGADPAEDIERFETVLGQAFEQELIVDAVIAKSESERHAIWEIRDDVLGFFELGPMALFDISVDVDRMADFVAGVEAFMKDVPEPINVTFGHLGDSNLHLMLGSRDAGAFDKDRIEAGVYDLIRQFHGSVSAEHGVGLLKREHLNCSRSAEELELMRRMKHMLDPNSILNPDKIFTQDKNKEIASP